MPSEQTICRLLRISCLVTCTIIFTDQANADERPDISKDLKSGHLAAAQESLTKYLSNNPKDDLARFQLGSVDFFAAIEGLAQDSYRYGLKPNFGMIPFLRTPIKANPKPDAVTYNDARKMIEHFVAKVEHAEATLSPIKETKLAWDLDITGVRLDMNGDGQADSDETLWSVFTRFARRAPQAARSRQFHDWSRFSGRALAARLLPLAGRIGRYDSGL